MICTTVRKETECIFMKSEGCSYNGGSCNQIVEQCNGCNRIIEISSNKFCTSIPEPAAKWKIGNCNMATHIVTESNVIKQKINPLKASKRRTK